MNPLRYLLGALAGCAAPLWCRIFDHGPWISPAWNGEQLQTVCRRCGEDV